MAYNKVTKALQTFEEEIALNTVDALIQAFKAEFELEEEELTAFTEKFKLSLKDKFKEQAKASKSKGSKASGSSSDGEKKKREPSAYNKFVKAEMERIKVDNPEVKGKELMAMAAANWRVAKATAKSDSE